MYYITGKKLCPSADTSSCPGYMAVNNAGQTHRASLLQQLFSSRGPRKSGGKKSKGGPGTILALICIVTILCVVGNWGFNALTDARAAASSSHVHGAGCAQPCPLMAAQNQEAAATEDRKSVAESADPEMGLLQQFFCPIIELPALHGISLSQQ